MGQSNEDFLAGLNRQMEDSSEVYGLRNDYRKFLADRGVDVHPYEESFITSLAVAEAGLRRLYNAGQSQQANAQMLLQRRLLVISLVGIQRWEGPWIELLDRRIPGRSPSEVELASIQEAIEQAAAAAEPTDEAKADIMDQMQRFMTGQAGALTPETVGMMVDAAQGIMSQVGMPVPPEVMAQAMEHFSRLSAGPGAVDFETYLIGMLAALPPAQPPTP